MGPEVENQTGASGSGSLRTRSHSRADPIWTVQDVLILVNEIAVVEGDCQNALSSYQKWSMIAENCTALDVVRNMNQCRRKWESLQAEYKLVKEWEANSRKDSYWSLSIQERKEIGLPLDLNRELYEAIDNFTKLQDQADTDPEDDPEATEFDVVDAEESGPKPKRVRRRSTPHYKTIEGSKQPVVVPIEVEPEKPVPTQPMREEEPEKPVTTQPMLEEEPEKPMPTQWSIPQYMITEETKEPMLEEELEKLMPICESTPQENVTGETEHVLEDELEKPVPIFPPPQPEKVTEARKQPVFPEEPEKPELVVEEMEQVHVEPKPKRVRHRSNPKKLPCKGNKQSTDPLVEEMKQTLAKKLKENTELIHAILTGNLTETREDEMCDAEDEEALNIERARSKADKLVSCLRDLAKNVEQLCDVEGC